MRWIPPIAPQCKINFDEACFSIEGVEGLGAVIRDASGQVHGALTQRMKIPLSATIIKALACHRAMIFVKDEGVLDYVRF